MPSTASATSSAPPTQPRCWKGFDLGQLRAFGIERTSGGIEVPYFTPRGRHWRSKLFRADGGSHWLGESKAQIPYGLETLKLGGDAIVLTEGESDALALRLAFPKLPVLGLPGASSWKRKWTVYVDDFCAVYMSFDADKAGERLAESVSGSLPHARTVRLPDGADTRDVIQKLGRRAYKVLVKEARLAGEWSELSRAWTLASREREGVDAAWRAAA